MIQSPEWLSPHRITYRRIGARVLWKVFVSASCVACLCASRRAWERTLDRRWRGWGTGNGFTDRLS